MDCSRSLMGDVSFFSLLSFSYIWGLTKYQKIEYPTNVGREGPAMKQSINLMRGLAFFSSFFLLYGVDKIPQRGLDKIPKKGISYKCGPGKGLA